MTWTRGAVVADRYRLEERVGAGSMGEVWAAVHQGVGSKVAIKRLQDASASNPEMVARLRREAFFLGRIQSPHVARVLDVVSDGRWGLALVMEFVEGDRLSDMLREQKVLGVEETVEIGADLASALCDLHKVGVIHRDLKPANIILRPGGAGRRRAMIVDFGLSRLLSEGDDKSEEITGITAANMALGTVEYMAPEQVLNSREVTQASDLYALGALLYRMVNGEHVFGALREGHLAHAKITRDPPPLRLERTDRIARGLESVVAHALRRRPNERYDRADLMLAELSSLRDLARLSALEIEHSDTDDGGVLPAHVTGRLPVDPDERPSDAAAATGDEPRSSEAITQRFGRAETLRIALGHTQPMPTVRMPPRTETASDAAPADGSDTTAASPRPRTLMSVGATSSTAAPARAPMSSAPVATPVGDDKTRPSWLLAGVAAALTLGVGFAAGRATAPDATSVASAPPSAPGPSPALASATTRATTTATTTTATTASSTEPSGATAAGAPSRATSTGAAGGNTTSPAAPPAPVGLPPTTAAPRPAAPRPSPRPPGDDPYQ